MNERLHRLAAIVRADFLIRLRRPSTAVVFVLPSGGERCVGAGAQVSFHTTTYLSDVMFVNAGTAEPVAARSAPESVSPVE